MTNETQQLSFFGDEPKIFESVEEVEGAMKISLNIKRPSEFFWVRRIRMVDIHQCCAKCFIGESETRLFHATNKGQTPRKIELNLTTGEQYIAYYLCGLSKGYVHHLNTHVAFLHRPGEILQHETSQMAVTINNARHIRFEHYKPNPPGYFNDYQRRCRNWIFANYIKDGMLGSEGG